MRRSYEERKSKKEFRMNIINRIKDLTPQARARVIEEISAQKYTLPYSGKDELSKVTIYRWLRQFRQHPDAETALMVKVRSDRGLSRALHEKQKDALKRWRYDNPYRTVEDLREELAFHAETTSDPLPSEATIARYLRSQGLSRETLLRGIKPQAKVRLAFEADYPQQLWMADTKGPNVYVNDPAHQGQTVLAKPVLLIDDCSRYIVAAMYVIVENEYVIMELFCQAILLYGIPEILYLDRGGPYMGKSLKKGANLIGCNVIHTSKQDAAAKGKIEKMLRTVHERFEQEMKALGKDETCLNEFNMYLQAYICQDYHRRVHSSTNETPEERFFALPAHLRRWISKDALARIFLPVKTAAVTKTGLVRVNNLKYLVNDACLWSKKVEVRHEYADKSKVYVWYQDQYYGEAHVYTEENDFIKREELTAKINSAAEIILPEVGQVPLYGRLDRQLAKHREEMAVLGLGEQLLQNRQKKEQVRSELLKETKHAQATKPSNFGADEFIYLMMKLLRKKFTPSERLAAHTLWNAAGPLDEKLVRCTVGKLLGDEHPIEDLKGYLEEIRLAVLTNQD
ncbi:MAG: Mu transposase C-terminal domain-containing protein [Bacillota bacterium]